MRPARYITGELWRFHRFRHLCVFLARHPRSPAWLTNWIWTETPFGIALHAVLLKEGRFDLAKEAAATLRANGC
jgi:hypothetical protein